MSHPTLEPPISQHLGEKSKVGLKIYSLDSQKCNIWSGLDEKVQLFQPSFGTSKNPFLELPCQEST
jgi:hypothetical protein